MWKELESNLVWQYDQLLEPDELAFAIDNLKTENARVERSNNHDSARIAEISFHYFQIALSQKAQNKLYCAIWKKINNWVNQIDQIQLKEPAGKPWETFLKCFGKGSHYHLHAEDSQLLGDWAYVLYLSDEEESPLTFPSHRFVQEMNPSEELQTWKQMEVDLKSKGVKITFPEVTLSVAAKVNRCVLFRTGVPHFISKYPRNYGRYCLTGFPNADVNL